MKITDIEAIALVWPPPEKHFWTALRPIGRVFNELLVRVYTDEGIEGIGEAHGAGQGRGSQVSTGKTPTARSRPPELPSWWWRS